MRSRHGAWVFHATKMAFFCAFDLFVAIVHVKGCLSLFGSEWAAIGDLECSVEKCLVVAKDRSELQGPCS